MSLKDLAASLGLSQTTVSRALNGYPEVSAHTRARVEAAAKAFAYRPNAQAKRLATGRAMAVGHIIALSNEHEIVNPVFADFIAGAGEVYSRAGYDMVLTIVPDRDEARAYQEARAKGNVDGFILHGPRFGDPRIGLLRSLGLPFVVHGRAGEPGAGPRDYAWCDVNNQRAFERATSFLLDLGHKRIALINGLEKLDFAQRRRSGFEQAHGARGLNLRRDLMVQGEMTEAHGANTARRMLALASPPTAFLTASLLSAMGVRRAIEEAGLTMGREVSVVTHDDDLGYLKNGEREPIFTATRSSVREAGRRSAAMLLAMIARAHGLEEEALTISGFAPQSALEGHSLSQETRSCAADCGETLLAPPPLRPHSAPSQLPAYPFELLEAELVVGRSTGPVPRA